MMSYMHYMHYMHIIFTDLLKLHNLAPCKPKTGKLCISSLGFISCDRYRWVSLAAFEQKRLPHALNMSKASQPHVQKHHDTNHKWHKWWHVHCVHQFPICDSWSKHQSKTQDLQTKPRNESLRVASSRDLQVIDCHRAPALQQSLWRIYRRKGNLQRFKRKR